MKIFSELTNTYEQQSESSPSKIRINKQSSSTSSIYDLNAIQTLELLQIKCYYSMKSQDKLMREQLLKWVVAKCKLTLELRGSTIQHCVRLFDLYMSKREPFFTTLDQAQLHLLTCLFISCKYEEIYPPSISDFQYICNYKFFAKDFILLEPLILKIIDYKLNIPLASQWLYGLSGKNLPEWVLLCLPSLGPGYSMKKLAEKIIAIRTDQDDGQSLEDEKIAKKLIELLGKRY